MNEERYLILDKKDCSLLIKSVKAFRDTVDIEHPYRSWIHCMLFKLVKKHKSMYNE
jgi:hypothetical protein